MSGWASAGRRLRPRVAAWSQCKFLTFLFVSLCPLSGCHSAFVSATVVNQTGGAVSLIEVDYPSASFGTETLAAGAQYHYRFKILGSGATKVSWTDSARHDHTVPGPALHEGEEGSLTLTLTPTGASWSPRLNP